MNPNLAITAENISKQYRLGEVGTGTLMHDLNRSWAKMRGREDPFLKIGDANDRSAKGGSDYVWSLKDINFEIEKGDAVGIIGRNGAGKSTLLKLLSRVTKPTTGHFEVQGRIASLLEVGTGFNPEMTGRENIFLNGAILGMRKQEIKKKFDEIVDFAGVERYIDTPVKRYSSGMYVRLAFAVAAHLESEILIVDEVLAVGDAEFQKKCLGKMGDVSKGEGRTVLFVSHNMGSIQELCNNIIYLDKGKINFIGKKNEGIDNYLAKQKEKNYNYNSPLQNTNDIYFKSVILKNKEGFICNNFKTSEYIFVEIIFGFNKYIQNSSVYITVNNSLSQKIFSVERHINEFEDSVKLKISKQFLRNGNYNLNLLLHLRKNRVIELVEEVCSFEVLDDSSTMMGYGEFNHGITLGNYEWVD